MTSDGTETGDDVAAGEIGGRGATGGAVPCDVGDGVTGSGDAGGPLPAGTVWVGVAGPVLRLTVLGLTALGLTVVALAAGIGVGADAGAAMCTAVVAFGAASPREAAVPIIGPTAAIPTAAMAVARANPAARPARAGMTTSRPMRPPPGRPAGHVQVVTDTS